MSSKSKKILAIMLAAVLVVVATIGTTLAYLQDTDAAQNVMTVGNVKIRQIEQEWNEDRTALQDFTQGKLLMPYVGGVAWETSGEYRRFAMNNVLDKYVSVENTGSQPAYVRTWFAFEVGSLTEARFEELLGMSINQVGGSSGDYPWKWEGLFASYGEIGGKKYMIVTATHLDVVEPGDVTVPSLLQIYLDKTATNEDVAALDGNGNGTFDILTFSQGVQAQGFSDAEAALIAAFGTAHPWTEEDLITPTLVTDKAELITALSNGESVTLTEDIVVDTSIQVTEDVVIDLNGNNLSAAVSNDGKAAAIIDNRGTLEITGTGTIDFVAEDPDMQAIPSYATNTITNEGTLVIGEGVVIKNGSDGGASYAVDNKGVFIMNGGTLEGNKCALRVAKYNQDNVYFEMNGGTIIAGTPAWIQLPGSSAASKPAITVVINDGVFKTTKASSANNDLLYTYSFGNSFANTQITINGGEFLGGTVSFGSGYYGDTETVDIRGGKFDYDVLRYTSNNTSEVIYNAN